MNEVILRGIIHNIEFSHKIKTTDFYKAIVEINDGESVDFVTIKFKQQYNTYAEGDYVELKGNLRSYSYKQDGRNKVNIYVFTYFDKPEQEGDNAFEIDGRVCKINDLYTTKGGQLSLQFILANNLYDESRGLKFNSYLPVVCWGEQAVALNESLNVNDQIKVCGKMHSRTYTKIIDGVEQVFEVQELVASDVRKI